ncbi:hypothetical protein [Streptomyces sp. NPDC001851]|uniref:hypothetical protein n=1 Tax=Streptomyces sp. NPDC001851 TaxID=3154529 RepID=UPI00332F1174
MSGRPFCPDCQLGGCARDSPRRVRTPGPPAGGCTTRHTDEEWTGFLGHFERRKVSIGTCRRSFSTPCIHEHACVRCPMLWPDPAQRALLVEIRDNLLAPIAEAERESRLGEVEGLKAGLAGAEDKLAQIDRRSQQRTVVGLGIPTTRSDAQ